MLLVLQIAQYEAVALEVKKLLLVLFWTQQHFNLKNNPSISDAMTFLDIYDIFGQFLRPLLF